MALNKLAAKPMLKVTAKPFTGPVPNKNRKKAAMTVVVLVSMIVSRALLNPASTAETGVLPTRSSSRIRSKTKIGRAHV